MRSACVASQIWRYFLFICCTVPLRISNTLSCLLSCTKTNLNSTSASLKNHVSHSWLQSTSFLITKKHVINVVSIKSEISSSYWSKFTTLFKHSNFPHLIIHTVFSFLSFLPITLFFFNLEARPHRRLETGAKYR